MNQVQPYDPETGEIVETGALAPAHEQTLAVSLARAEIDQQVATARAMPRHIKRVANNIYSLATLDPDTAAECVYVLPRGGKQLRGPSVRLAEIIANQWGNNRVGARVVHIDRIEKWIEAEGVFHDLETNTATTARVRRRISDRSGRIFNDDMIVVTGNAACAIAKRNAILGGIPKAVWRQAYQATEAVLAGDEKPLVEVRAETLKAFAAMGVSPAQVCARVDLSDPEEITRDHVVTLRALYRAIRDGETTADDEFPPIDEGAKDKGKAAKGGGLKSKMDAAAKDAADNESGGGGTPPAEGRGEGHQAAAQPAGDQADSNDSPAGNSDPALAANRAGVSAARKGMSRDAIPPAYAKDDALKAAWLAGFDSEAANTGGGDIDVGA